jgi:hypothetical protein
MSIPDSTVTQSLEAVAMQAFGLAMPRMATDWLESSGTIKAQDADMTVMTADSSGDTTKGPNWLAPLDCHIYLVDFVNNAPMPVTLIKPDDSVDSGGGVLLTVFEQSWLRLCRLYTQVLEDSTNTSSRPEYAKNLPWRPVPKYFFFPGATTAVKQGIAETGAPLGFSGAMRIYDGDGLPIDPVAVMAAFLALQKKYSAFETPVLGSQAAIPLETYLNSLATTTEVRLRLVKPDGSHHDGTHLTNLTAVPGASNIGLFKITSGQSSSQNNVGLDTVNATSFPQYDHDRLVFGPATSGRLTSTFTPPTPPTSTSSSSSSVTLKRDFFTLRVVELQTYIAGKWPAGTGDPACKVQRQPTVRLNENVTFLADGNALFAAINTALPGASNPMLMVAQALDGTFNLPSASSTHWPAWPSNATVDNTITLSIDLKNGLTLTANWFAPNATDPTQADVVLKISGLPANTVNAWLRVYPRKFRNDADAAEERGDGQGGPIQTDPTTTTSGTISLYLTDPLSLRDPTDATGKSIHRPANASLMFDIIIVLPSAQSRIYGNLSVNIGSNPVTNPSPAAGSNPGATAGYRGISKSGVLGLGKPGTVPLGTPPTTKDGWAQFLKDDAQPRDAPRLPTMARRELLAAGKGTSAWSGVIGGGQLAKEGISADARIGEPGGAGGRETILVGASTNGGILAYDIARHAFRRTTNIVDRMNALDDSKWDTPTAPTAVAVGGTPTATNGTFAGALLQTVAPNCETPELGALPSTWDPQLLINNVKTYLDSKLTGTIKTTVDQAISQQLPDPPTPIEESSKLVRLAVEAQREIASAYFGRRDAQWSLQTAIQNARHFIYLETPGFCSTVATVNVGGFTADLIDALSAQLSPRPGLRLVICTPKYPDFAPGYEGFLAYEVTDRLAIMKTLPPNQAVLFHPIGFPGRFSRVETNVVIVDDMWAMIGGASFRRRGLASFDSGSDLVVTDTQLENGRSPSIRDFRRTLMATRLGITADSTVASYVALNRGATAFALVRETLAAGGLGKIAPVWDGKTPGKPLALPVGIDVANPDGRTLDVVALMANGAIATSITSSGL